MLHPNQTQSYVACLSYQTGPHAICIQVSQTLRIQNSKRFVEEVTTVAHLGCRTCGVHLHAECMRLDAFLSMSNA
jgi:hypothetical protein